MIDKIMVPTDGSKLSEAAAPAAIELAAAQGARITFVQVVQYLEWLTLGPEAYLSADVYQQMMDAQDHDARENLRALAARAQDRGVPVEMALLHGSPAAQLLEFEAESRPGLVVMATHGRSGLTRFALGSVADRILREGVAPALLVRAFAEAPRGFEKALVPMDGSATAEDVLPTVETLANKPVRSVRLARAVPTGEDRIEADAYLRDVADRLRSAGLEVEIHVAVGRPFDVIAAAAEPCDLVIMATHGRGGLDRLRHGSIADRALSELTRPVLLVRASARASIGQGLATSSSSGRS
ncbi:MAG TPA: universal stress protein [Chloroflexota bacterium]|nr:universal stress protein [Chloroflexota bacterium]